MNFVLGLLLGLILGTILGITIVSTIFSDNQYKELYSSTCETTNKIIDLANKQSKLIEKCYGEVSLPELNKLNCFVP